MSREAQRQMVRAQYETILKEAHEAAAKAQEGLVEDMNAFDCGFAWVNLSGNHPLVRYCRSALKKLEAQQKNYADRHHYGRKEYPQGWCWWKPGSFPGQSVTIHEKGAYAFRDVLAKYGISATVGSRLD